MAFEKQPGAAAASTEQACIHLRSKAMIVTGKLRPLDDAEEEHGGHCWCNITQHVVGPDRKDVDQADCVSGRDCYQVSR